MTIETFLFRDLLPEKLHYLCTSDGTQLEDRWVSRVQLDESLPTDSLVILLMALNKAYRSGHRVVPDPVYDSVFRAELISRDPNHPFLCNVEPDYNTDNVTRLPQLMLSTKKAYEFVEIQKWLVKVKNAATVLGIDWDSVRIRVTPKLDGYAAFLDVDMLYLRGDGAYGQDVSYVLERGLSYSNKTLRGPGEIVVDVDYFDKELSSLYNDTRGVIASVIKPGPLSPTIKQALQLRKIVFVQFEHLNCWVGSPNALQNDWDNIVVAVWKMGRPHDIDGIVLEVTHPEIRALMSHTSDHHRWQIAFKQQGDTHIVPIVASVPQVGMTGRVTPVIQIRPTRIGRVTVTRATAHHYGMVRDKQIGVGGEVLVVRAGEVIPKIIGVITPAPVNIPAICPCCNTPLVWDNDYLMCINVNGCSAQHIALMYHYFRRIGNSKGLGKIVLKRLYDFGYTDLVALYSLTPEKLAPIYPGPLSGTNILRALKDSSSKPVEDWRFLSAFGIDGLGRSNSKAILTRFPFDRLFELTVEELLTVPDIGSKTATAIIRGLALHRRRILDMYEIHNGAVNIIRRVPLINRTGLSFCFTGTMETGTRDAVILLARNAGYQVTDKVTRQTTHLVTGLKPSAGKILDANKYSLPIIQETQFVNEYLPKE